MLDGLSMSNFVCLCVCVHPFKAFKKILKEAQNKLVLAILAQKILVFLVCLYNIMHKMLAYLHTYLHTSISRLSPGLISCFGPKQPQKNLLFIVYKSLLKGACTHKNTHMHAKLASILCLSPEFFRRLPCA